MNGGDVGGGDAAGRIVVGVDGSPSSRVGLHWAVRQGELTGAEVHAVIAWTVPVTYGAMPIAQVGEYWSATASEGPGGRGLSAPRARG